MKILLCIIIVFFSVQCSAAEKNKVEPPKAKPRRFLTAHERLPQDIPTWFITLDILNEGQLYMWEFNNINEWTPELIKEFQHYDLNDDGIITAEEAIKVTKADNVKKKKSDKNSSQSSPNTSTKPSAPVVKSANATGERK